MRIARWRWAMVAAALVAGSVVVVPAIAGAAPAAVTADTFPYLVITAPNDTAGAKSAVATNGGTVHASYDAIGVIVAKSAATDFADKMRAVSGVQQVGKSRTKALASGAGLAKTEDLERRMLEPTRDKVSARQQVDEPLEWDMKQIKADQAWPVSTGSPDVVVGVLDTGIDDTHEDLSANFSAANSASCVGGKANTTSGAWRPTSSEAGSDHGTHVAGSIAAAKNGKGIVGTAPGVKVAAVRVSEGTKSWFYSENVICGFMWAAEHKFKVTNNSYYVDPWLYNCPTDKDQAAIAEGVTRAAKYAESQGVINVVAAGNDNTDLSAATRNDTTSPNDMDGFPPARYNLPNTCLEMPQEVPGVVMVSGTDSSGTRYSSSNYGVDKIDVAAPAVNVKSTVPGNQYGTKTGTSMASPHAAGVAALLASKNPSATVDQLRKMLREQAQDWPCANSGGTTCKGTTAYNSIFGDGVVDAYKAVTVGDPGPTPPAVANPGNQTSTVGKPVSLSNSATGGKTPYTWSATGLPAGLTINSSTGTISGTPTTAGSSNVTVTVTDSSSPALTGTASFTWTVNPDSGGSNAITNGGFESDLSGWTVGGTAKSATIVTSGAHGGSKAVRLGAATATNGESTVSQTFTAGSASNSVSFWYNITCPDTVTYAWAKATLKDNTDGTTTTPLGKTCTNGQGWKSVSAPVTAGHNYTLTLVNRDDNHPDDPVYTLFDDVSAGSADPGGDDYAVSADPASVTVQKGQSTSSTIKTTVTSGGAQKVTLSASGLPSGATAMFDPTSVTAGGSSTLTISTSSTTPDGTSTVTINADGTTVDRSTTLSLTVTGGGGEPGALKRISRDPYTDTVGQHETQVEADSAAWGSTIVSVFQSGRTNNGGASSDMWATSTDGGNTWQTGRMPNLTTADGGPWDRASDPVVAYSAKHGKWLFGALAIKVVNGQLGDRNMTIQTSSDGLSWSNPVNGIVGTGASLDKNGIACDNYTNSPHYGTCYITIDDNGNNNQLWIAKSTDGGATWAAPVKPTGATGTLPFSFVVQPDGRATVIYDRVSGGNSQMAISSTNGGTSWGAPKEIAGIPSWHQPVELRGNPSPTAGVDSSGKIYVVWADCRFRSSCTVNDLVMSTSTDAQTWSTPVRIPIGTTSDSIEKYIPRLAVDPATSGSSGKLALWYYTYENAACSSDTTCKIKVQYVSSADGGSSWSTAQDLSPFFPLNQIADTTQNRMVGDYSGGSFVNGKAVGVFSVGATPSGGKAFDQAMYSFGPQTVTGGAVRANRANAVTGRSSQHQQKGATW